MRFDIVKPVKDPAGIKKIDPKWTAINTKSNGAWWRKINFSPFKFRYRYRGRDR